MQTGRRLTILVDADDVMLDTCPHWVRWLDRKYSMSVSPEDITEWELTPFFSGLSEGQVHAPLLDPEFWRTVPAREGALEVCTRLREDGHALYVVTATDPRNAGVKFERMCALFPFLDARHFIVAYDKYMVDGDVLIDDYAPNLVGVSCQKFLMTRPHNAGLHLARTGIIRVANWEEVYSLCAGLSLFTHI